MDMFRIKNVEFLPCLNDIDRLKNIELYKFIEKLIYNEIPDINKYKLKLKNENKSFIKNLKFEIIETEIYTEKNKRKNIKENMIENYVIKNNKDKKFLKDLNLKIFLKSIPNKNISVLNGNISNIDF